jgi:hypothetical protein
MGTARSAFSNEFSRSRIKNLRVPKRIAEKQAERRGAIPQEAATWETLPLVHLQVT